MWSKSSTVRTSQSNHRSSDGWLIDRNAALGHLLLEIAPAELGGQVPAHAADYLNGSRQADREAPIAAGKLLNDPVAPFF